VKEREMESKAKRKYQWEIRQTSVMGYVLAVWSESGYAHYQTFQRVSTHYQRRIRRILEGFAERGEIEVPLRIDWSEIKPGDFIKPFETEEAA
jgi:hypothetical protein